MKPTYALVMVVLCLALARYATAFCIYNYSAGDVDVNSGNMDKGFSKTIPPGGKECCHYSDCAFGDPCSDLTYNFNGVAKTFMAGDGVVISDDPDNLALSFSTNPNERCKK